ncbi:MAG: YdjY domain-containing protein [Planctomycetota bacterium]
MRAKRASSVVSVLAVALLGTVAGCAGDPPKGTQADPSPAATPQEPLPFVKVQEPKRVVLKLPEPIREVFPGVRLDKDGGGVEFDGEIAVDAHSKETPNVFLEVIVCRADSREHESVVVTKALPSHVHAALLLLGAEPGVPASWKKDESGAIVSVPPKGQGVVVTVTFTAPSGLLYTLPANEFARSQRGGARLGVPPKDAPPAKSKAEQFVFAGSRFMKVQGAERYAADISGTIVGLCSFGDEPIAWSGVYNPDAATEEPQWMIDASVTPPKGTKVTVRMELAKEGVEQD